MINAAISIPLENPQLVFDSLKPEIEDTARFSVQFNATDNELQMKVNAQDVKALKGAINSYLRLIELEAHI